VATPVYSARFLEGVLSTSASASYAVPDGFRAVVHSFTITPTTDVGATVGLGLSGGADFDQLTLTTGATENSARSTSRYVFYAGETMVVQEGGLGPTNVYVGGYLLTEA